MACSHEHNAAAAGPAISTLAPPQTGRAHNDALGLRLSRTVQNRAMIARAAWLRAGDSLQLKTGNGNTGN